MRPIDPTAPRPYSTAGAFGREAAPSVTTDRIRGHRLRRRHGAQQAGQCRFTWPTRPGAARAASTSAAGGTRGTEAATPLGLVRDTGPWKEPPCELAYAKTSRPGTRALHPRSLSWQPATRLTLRSPQRRPRHPRLTHPAGAGLRSPGFRIARCTSWCKPWDIEGDSGTAEPVTSPVVVGFRP